MISTGFWNLQGRRGRFLRAQRMKLENQKILVTGATGFIGGHVARRLIAEKSAAVRALVRDPAKAQGLAKLGVELVQGDLGDSAALARAVRGCPVVIHAAAQVSSVPGAGNLRTNQRGGHGKPPACCG